MKRTRFLFILHLLIAQAFSQSPLSYYWPLKGTFPLTGNYGEIRPNHFHMGLDLSTKNLQNYPVFAIADGYVSRIRVSSVGYGKSVYITHPDGHLSLYAHLNKFEEPLASYLKKIMLEQQVNEIDLTLADSILPIKRAQQIGFSGNTGGSSGPHLHFEIRDTKSEIPLNPLLFFGHTDTYAPVVHALALYDLRDSLRVEAPLRKQIRVLRQTKDTAFVADIESSISIMGLGFSGSDLLEKGGNSNQIAKAELWIDTVLIYRHYFSHMQFDDARYVNEFADKMGHQKFQRCFMPEQYPSGIHEFALNRGRIFLQDTLRHKFLMRLSDEASNSKIVTGSIRAKQLSAYLSKPCKSNFVVAGAEYRSTSADFNMVVPQKALYYSSCLEFSATAKSFTISPSNINLHTALKIAKIDTSAMAGKTVLSNGSTYAVPNLQNDSVFWDIKSTGAWRLELDTIAPQLSAKFPKGKHAVNAKQLHFSIADKKSGIGAYDLYLNSKWVPVYYDAKSSQLIFELDSTVPKGKLDFKLQVKDKCGNTATLRASFNKS